MILKFSGQAHNPPFAEKKKYHKEPDEPISFRRVFPLVEEVVEYLQSKSWERTFNGKPNEVKKKDEYGFQIKVLHGKLQFELNHRPFPISKSMADNWVKFVFEGFYCHLFQVSIYHFRNCNCPT